MTCYRPLRGVSPRILISGLALAAAIAAFAPDVRAEARTNVAAPSAGARESSPIQAYYRRLVMKTAASRCGLFEGPVTTALNAGVLQARNALLLSDTDPALMQRAAREARESGRVMACAHPELQAEAAQVRSAYKLWQGTHTLSLPGRFSDWQADRSSINTRKWRLIQTPREGLPAGGDVAFGLYGSASAFRLVAWLRLPEAVNPYSARLVTRNRDLDSHPWIRTQSGPMVRYSRAGAQVILAEARLEGAEALTPLALVREGDAPEQMAAFAFPVSALKSLAMLDPREDLALEFDTQSGTLSLPIETGQFAPGLAFMGLPPIMMVRHR
ncbi:MAG: hypothetical protein ACK41P_08975 [Asticcacaulis sp.]